MRRTSLLTLVLCSSPQPCAALDVTISAFAETGPHRLGYGGTVVLSVPWGRWFGQPPPGALLQLSQGADDDAASDEQAEAPAPAPRDPVPEAEAADGEPVEVAGVAGWTLLELSPAFVGALLDSALREFDRIDTRLDSLASRSRSSAWLPAMSLRAGRNIDQTLRLTPTDSDPDRWQLTGGADLRLEAQLKWEFDRLVYASDELAVERLRASAEQRRTQHVDKVLDWLFRWQMAQLQAAEPLSEPLERAAATLRASQAQRALDVLTGGWFTPHLRAETERQTAR